jgi:hypothetical protein
MHYSKEEANNVSSLYQKYSYLSSNDVVVLDIEVVLNSDEGKDKIDVLLFNKKEQSLKFVEAKRFSDSRLFSESSPEVIAQIKRYEKQVQNENTYDMILLEYQKYISNINQIFGVNLPKPLKIEKKVVLWIFGFDTDQKVNRLETEIINSNKFSGVKIYARGKTPDTDPKNLWNTK